MTRYKYPRTPHLPFSEGATDDDKILTSTAHLEGKMVVVTEKMDGENTTIYCDHCHARSIDSKHKSYHSWLLSYIPTFQAQIPKGWRICAEYLYATHSIKYENLYTFLMVFSIWNDKNEALSWEKTKEIAQELGLQTVPVIYEGIYDEQKIKSIASEVVERGGEGIVVRICDSFHYDSFSTSVAKFVRHGHIQTNAEWNGTEKNKLKK